ncbi:MAG: glycosyltransferase family 4 protein [Anaerolineae bacterium]
MTTIGIDYTSAIHQSAGIGRYTREMVNALAQIDAQSSYRLFVADAGKNIDPPGTNFTCHTTRLTERWLARLWYRLQLPLRIETWTGPLNLFHQPDFFLPPVKPGTRTIVTIHDLSFERQPSDTIMPGMEAHLKKWVPYAVQQADHIIAVSKATRQDLIELYQTHPEKITVLYHGVTPEFQPISDSAQLAEVRHKYNLGDRPFLLSVSTIQPRKNYRRLIQAFAQIDDTYSLVIAGSKGWGYDDVFAEVTRLGLEDRVHFPGFITDADLPALYNAASLFVYPSLYEGFGMPVLEAQACGTPVVTSNVPPLPETAGDAALLADPYDVEALATCLDQILRSETLRSKLRERGLAHARQFTWARMAQETARVYRRAASIDVR